MKPLVSILALTFAILALALPGCTSLPVDPTPRQQVAANIAEDILANGLVLVFARNPAYVDEGGAVVALLSVSTAVTITPESIAAILAKTKIAPDDARIIAAVVSSAWDTYQRRYAVQVGASVRPDVRMFLAAVANGIERAIAAVPRP